MRTFLRFSLSVLADLITEKFDETTLTASSNKLTLNIFSKADKFMDKLSMQYGEVNEKIERLVFQIWVIYLYDSIFFSVSVEPWNQVKKKRKILNSNTVVKKKRSNIFYKS